MKCLTLTLSLLLSSALIGCTSPDPPQPSMFIAALDLESEVNKVAVEGVDVSPEVVVSETMDRHRGSDTTSRLEATVLLSGDPEKLSEYVSAFVSQLRKRILAVDGNLRQIDLRNHNLDAGPLVLDYSMANTEGSIRISQSESTSTGFPRKLTVLIEESVRNP